MASAHISRSIEGLDLLKLKRMALELQEYLEPHREVLTPAQQGFRVKICLIKGQIDRLKDKIHYALWNLICAEAVRILAQRKVNSLPPQQGSTEELFSRVNKVAVLKYKLHKHETEKMIGAFTEQLTLQDEIEIAGIEMERVKRQYVAGEAAAEAAIQLKNAQDDVAIWISVCDSVL